VRGREGKGKGRGREKERGVEVKGRGRKGEGKGFAGPMSNGFLRACDCSTLPAKELGNYDDARTCAGLRVGEGRSLLFTLGAAYV